jgi:hypothetical protein
MSVDLLYRGRGVHPTMRLIATFGFVHQSDPDTMHR